MSLASLGLAAVAGALSTLSPCVLPLVPIVLGSAATEHRYGPLALATGLALSFTAIGLFVATIGFAIGLDAALFRNAAATILLVIGAVLMVPAFQERFAVTAGPAGHWFQNQFGDFSTSGIHGQFALGLLLGAVWSPCAGPTLGAASVLASQGANLAEVTLTMALFGIGAALPLLLIGSISRERVARLRGTLSSTGHGMRIGLGGLLFILGLAVLLGFDKPLEAWLVDHLPDWLTRLTTSI